MIISFVGIKLQKIFRNLATMKKYISTLLALLAVPMMMAAQEKSLHQLQQEFVDLRLGMFVHFGLPTYQTAD